MLFNQSIKYAIIASIALSMFYLTAVAEFDIVSTGDGVLAINDSDVKISAPSSGIIKKIYVSRGSRLKEGDKLLTIENIEDENKRQLFDFNVIFFKKQLNKLARELFILRKVFREGEFKDDQESFDSIKLLKVKNKFEFFIQKKEEFSDKKKTVAQEVKSLNTQQGLLSDKENLLKTSLGKTVRYLDVKLESEKLNYQIIEREVSLKDIKSQVDSAYADFIQLTLEQIEQTENELKRIQESFASTSSELDIVKARIKSTDIISTVNGSVLNLMDGLAAGTFIDRNMEIMTLKRKDDGIYIDAKFDSKFRPYISLDSVVKVKINAPGIKDYFYGKIEDISVDSFDHQEYSKQGSRYYRVKVALDANRGKADRLSKLLGIKTTVFVVNNEMTFIEYVLSTFNRDLDFVVW